MQHLTELRQSMSTSCTDIDDLNFCDHMSNEHVKTLDYEIGEPDWDTLKAINPS